MEIWINSPRKHFFTKMNILRTYTFLSCHRYGESGQKKNFVTRTNLMILSDFKFLWVWEWGRINKRKHYGTRINFSRIFVIKFSRILGIQIEKKIYKYILAQERTFYAGRLYSNGEKTNNGNGMRPNFIRSFVIELSSVWESGQISWRKDFDTRTNFLGSSVIKLINMGVEIW